MTARSPCRSRRWRGRSAGPMTGRCGRSVARVLAALPPGGRVAHVGAFPNRAPRAVRLVVQGVGYDEIAGGAGAVGPPRVGPRGDGGPGRPRGGVAPGVWLSVDVAAAGLLPRLGLELHRAGEWGNEPDRWLTTGRSDWRPVVERLVHRGLVPGGEGAGADGVVRTRQDVRPPGRVSRLQGTQPRQAHGHRRRGRRQGIRRHDLLPHAGLTHLSHRPSLRRCRDAAAVGRTDRKTLPARRRRTCLKSDSASPPERCATNTSIAPFTTYHGDRPSDPRAAAMLHGKLGLTPDRLSSRVFAAGSVGGMTWMTPSPERSEPMETPKEIRMKIVGKATGDADFRARLLSDPKGAIGQELGVTIPASLSVRGPRRERHDRASGSSPRQQAERKRSAGGRRRRYLRRKRRAYRYGLGLSRPTGNPAGTVQRSRGRAIMAPSPVSRG